VHRCWVHLRGACKPPPAAGARRRNAPDRRSRAQAGRQTADSHRQQGRESRCATSPRVHRCWVHLRGACKPPPAAGARRRNAPDRRSRAQAGRQTADYAPTAQAWNFDRLAPSWQTTVTSKKMQGQVLTPRSKLQHEALYLRLVVEKTVRSFTPLMVIGTALLDHQAREMSNRSPTAPK